MKARIEVSMDTPAFKANPLKELARILRAEADLMAEESEVNPTFDIEGEVGLSDSDGFSVGLSRVRK